MKLFANALLLGTVAALTANTAFATSDSYDLTVADWLQNGYITSDEAATAARCKPLWTGSYSLEAYNQKINSSNDPWTQCIYAKNTQQAVVATRAETTQIVRSVTTRMSALTRPSSATRGGTAVKKTTASLGTNQGLAAGDAGNKFGVWGNVQHTDSTQKNVQTKKVKSDQEMGTLGFDVRITPAIMAGFGLFYDQTDTKTDNTNKVDRNTLTAVPYMAYKFNDLIGLDALIGFSDTNASSDASDSKRWMGAMGLNGYYPIDRLMLSSRLGYMISSTKEDQVDNRKSFDQATLSGEASYALNNLGISMVEPYVGLGFEKDTRHEGGGASYDSTGWLVNVGSRFQFNNRLSGDLKLESTEGRKDINEFSYMANVRYEF